MLHLNLEPNLYSCLYSCPLFFYYASVVFTLGVFGSYRNVTITIFQINFFIFSRGVTSSHQSFSCWHVRVHKLVPLFGIHFLLILYALLFFQAVFLLPLPFPKPV